MATRVSTGGTKSFEYNGEVGKLDEERKKEIEKGYAEYYGRKAREKRNRNILIVVITIIVLMIFGFFLLGKL